MSETTPITVSPVEEQITTELVKHNVTEAKIAELKEKYLPLQIKGIDDKETYLMVKEARKECKSLRVLAEKLCKKGREEAVAIQKAWVAKEKEVTGQIGEVEDHLERQEKEFDEQVKAEKLRRQREQEEQFIMRNQVLSGMNVLYSDGFYTLGEVSFEMSLIKECDSDIWEADILPKFQEAYQKDAAERLEQERIQQEREAEMKWQQEELDRKQQEIEQREAALKAAQEEQERKQREEEEKKAAEAKAARDAKQKARMDQMYALGLTFDFSDNHFKGYNCFVSHLDILTYDDEKWNRTVEELTVHIAAKKEEAEQKRLVEIETQKEAERIKVLVKERTALLKSYGVVDINPDLIASHTIEEWESVLDMARSVHEDNQRRKWEAEQEEKRKADELKKQQEMEQAKDKEKWSEMARQVNAIEVYEMRSSQYRTKAMKFRQKLDELKALFDGQN